MRQFVKDLRNDWSEFRQRHVRHWATIWIAVWFTVFAAIGFWREESLRDTAIKTRQAQITALRHEAAERGRVSNRARLELCEAQNDTRAKIVQYLTEITNASAPSSPAAAAQRQAFLDRARVEFAPSDCSRLPRT